jgi:superfamily II DNA or RNA helicase
MILGLPRLERLIYKKAGSKNIVLQVLAIRKNINASVTGNTRSGIKITDSGTEYYLTKNKADRPENINYILTTNIKPTENKINNGKAVIKDWIKHPDYKEYTPDEIINSWENSFSYIEENIQKRIKGLRQPQIGALHMIMGHLKLPLETGNIVLPTGTGKTETMLSALVANKCKKLLVVVPSDSLRKQISEKFLTFGLLQDKEFKIIAENALRPAVGVMKQGFNSVDELKEFVEKSNVLISTMDILTGMPPEQNAILVSECSQVFIDEAHHVKASTWNSFKTSFPHEKVIQFTATPFRNDGKRLDGKILFNFPLKEAQRQGYFKQIDFLPVRIYDTEKADEEIADKAVGRLKEDIGKGYNHILMARCATKERARKVFELYRKHKDLKPVILYSGATGFKETYERIIKKEAKIIVCVDMLGEGFDLPELKIAAFHDIRKSLPITLQFAGRFTRTKHDEELGNASFIANLADLDVREELADLYSRDADWNQILSDISYGRIQDEVEYKQLISGFTKLNDSKIPFQNIKVKLSTVVYKNKTDSWFPSNFKAGISKYDDLPYKFDDLNRDENILIIITADKSDVEWVENKDIFQLNWNIIVAYWETRNNLLFINSSDNSSLYYDLAKAIMGDKVELVRGIDVFKAFHNVKRIRLQNVGLRYFLGKNERFRMMVGSDVAEALSMAERKKGEKAFVMGIGFEYGEPVNLGASYKGRIWTKQEDDLKGFKTWCIALGNKLINPAIDSDQVLKDTLVPANISKVPDVYPVWIDWDIEMYLFSEAKFRFEINGEYVDLSSADLSIVDPTPGGPLKFSVKSENNEAQYELELYENTTGDDSYPDFRINQLTAITANVTFGAKSMPAKDFFAKYVPTIWFADGSALTGNEYVELKQVITVYPKKAIEGWDWTGVNLNAESQHVNPLIQDSIQYKVIQELNQQDFDVIYDDDYSGEIADVIAMKLYPDRLKVNLYHLKYAIDGVVSNQVKNLYEVCGQAQKSIHWKHKKGSDFINHLLRRKTKVRNNYRRSRIEKGVEKDIEKLLSIVKREIPVEFEIYIVQPGFSKANASEEILTLLGVTENYIKEIAGINLKVIASA